MDKRYTVGLSDVSHPALQKGGFVPPFSLGDFFHEVTVNDCNDERHRGIFEQTVVCARQK